MLELVIAAIDQEVGGRKEVRLHGWERDDIAFLKEWELKSSKLMDIEFMRMNENRSEHTN